MKKLVRDKIPGLVSNLSKVEICKSNNEKVLYLTRKLLEESAELGSAVLSDDREHIIEELADVYEVLDALLVDLNISKASVLETQADKLEARGGFKSGFLLELADA